MREFIFIILSVAINIAQLFFNMRKPLFFLLVAVCMTQCSPSHKTISNTYNEFPDELVHFVPFKNNPVFAGTGTATWDNQIRERGWILKEDNTYHLWYTGYTNIDSTKYLGYATSPDGFTWTRYKDNPIHSSNWVEDMCVIKSGNTYYMFAEGKGDTAHMLTSTDRVHWTEQGNLDIRLTSGNSISKGPYGTPSVLKENGIWYLFYERDDSGIWLATSKDLKTWTNVQDEPVLKCGPEQYDKFAVAMNQVIKYKGLYYGYYHASAFKDWHEWSTNVAVSNDLIHWTKYVNNPIVDSNKSSGILINDGMRYRLYTMHPEVNVYFPARDSASNR
jgi:beta-1,2-mannobiose phosphorylase / 1,2-beta-oligomannan phosphorylase